MTRQRYAPLDSEERELAERLARLGVGDGPSSELDARILSAAHAAIRPHHATTIRGRRWPMMVGVAATLVLAVGIAWRMRPAPGDQVAYSEAPVAAMRTGPGPSAATAGIDAEDMSTVERQAEASAATPSETKPAQSANQGVTTPARVKAQSADVESVEDAQAFPAQDAATQAAPAAPPEEPGIVFDAPSPADIPAPVPAAPPAPPPAAAAPAAGAETATMGIANGSERVRREAANQARKASAPTAAGRAATSDERDSAGFSDAVIDDQPPATADSPAVQQAWLQRIRELVRAGEIDAAKASLGEFKRRNPNYALPVDLRDYAP